MGINYFRHGNVIEIIVRDDTNAKIERHTCAVGEKVKYRKILDYLRDKYGFEPSIDVDEMPQVPERKEDDEEGLDWLGMSK